MIEKIKNNSKRTLLAILLSLVSIVIVGAFALIYSKAIDIKSLPFLKSEKKTEAVVQAVGTIPEFDYLNYSKAELSVKGLINSSDLYKIKNSVKGFKGIEKLLIDLENGKVEVYFDEAKMKNTDKIAKQIKKKSGFDAQLTRILNKSDMNKEDDYNRKIKELYVATVNDFDISMADFNKEINMLKSKYIERYGEDIFNSPRSARLLENIKVQSIMTLIDDTIIKRDIASAEFILEDEVVEVELNKMLEDNSITLEEAAKRSGYKNQDYFVQKLKSQVIIKNYIENEIFAPTTIDAQKGIKYKEWFLNIKSLSKTVYYNPQLKASVVNAQTCSIKGCADPSCVPKK